MDLIDAAEFVLDVAVGCDSAFVTVPRDAYDGLRAAVDGYREAEEQMVQAQEREGWR